MTYLVSFDLEMDRLITPQWDCKITCGSMYSDGGGSKLYYSIGHDGVPIAAMRCEDLGVFVDDLFLHVNNGAMIVSWGGCAVDFRALFSNLVGDYVRQMKVLSMIEGHIDIPICSATDMGVMMGLDAACKGMNIGSKEFKSVSAPDDWKMGRYEQVLDHVKNDAIFTMKVYNAIFTHNPPCLMWTSKSNKKKQWYCSWKFDGRQIRLLTVNECLQRKTPKTKFPILPGMDRDEAVRWFSIRV